MPGDGLEAMVKRQDKIANLYLFDRDVAADGFDPRPLDETGHDLCGDKPHIGDPVLVGHFV